jgi:hypothetical protein
MFYWPIDIVLPSRGRAQRPFLLPKVITARQSVPVDKIDFDWVDRALCSQCCAGFIMLAYIAGVLVVLSVAILIAHALDAFRSG